MDTTMTLALSSVQLSSTEILYLNERLQNEENMSFDDAVSTIIELENYYTLLKNAGDRIYSPSLMVDKAWHQHILHTKMYNAFSRRHFGIDCLHHLPFWSGNTEEVDELSGNPEELGSKITYEKLIAMLGVDHVNQTIWFPNEEEIIDHRSSTIQHTEF